MTLSRLRPIGNYQDLYLYEDIELNNFFSGLLCYGKVFSI